MGRADLHIHTTASDGMHAPTEIVQLAKQAGLAAIAITDHDTTGGIREAMEAGDRLGMIVVPGVEISTQVDGKDIHILGYYIDPEDKLLSGRLEHLRSIRDRRNERIIGKLNEQGIRITLSEVWHTVKKKPGEELTIGRPHIAEVLVRKGVVGSIPEAFDRYLGEGGSAYVSPERISPQEAARWIHEAGGSAVIAHPGLYGDDELVERIIGCGVDGIEAFHSDHSPEEEIRYAVMAERAGLVATAGSDYHGERMKDMRHQQIGERTAHVSLLQRLNRRG
jgi:Predicted metal-dependent phosphoesterases (PHP family)